MEIFKTDADKEMEAIAEKIKQESNGTIIANEVKSVLDSDRYEITFTFSDGTKKTAIWAGAWTVEVALRTIRMQIGIGCEASLTQE